MRGVRMAPLHPLTIFCFEPFDCFFFRACQQFASYSRKIIENLEFAAQIEIFPKYFFCPATTYSGLCSSDHTCMKILFLIGFLGLGVICSDKNFEVRRFLVSWSQVILLISTAVLKQLILNNKTLCSRTDPSVFNRRQRTGAS